MARGITESESSQAQALESHHEKLAEIGGITKDQAAVLTGQARVGGGWDFIVKAGADGSVMWRGQTIESEAWNRIKEYDRQHGVTETWSQVADASKRYSTQTGDSEMAGLDESLSANLTRMRSFQERASLSRQESESWSEQAAQVRSDAQAIGRDLGQPFFAWLSERKGSDGRAIGTAGAMRIASPQTAEDSEQLREYAAAFIAEKYPAPAGTGPGDGRRRGGIRRRGRRVARRLWARDGSRVRRMVGRVCRDRAAASRHAPAGRDRGRGKGRAGGDRDGTHHEEHGPRRPPDRHQAGDGARGPSRGRGRNPKTLRAACDGGPARRRRLARGAAVRHREERRSRRRARRGGKKPAASRTRRAGGTHRRDAGPAIAGGISPRASGVRAPRRHACKRRSRSFVRPRQPDRRCRRAGSGGKADQSRAADAAPERARAREDSRVQAIAIVHAAPTVSMPVSSMAATAVCSTAMAKPASTIARSAHVLRRFVGGVARTRSGPSNIRVMSLASDHAGEAGKGNPRCLLPVRSASPRPLLASTSRRHGPQFRERP